MLFEIVWKYYRFMLRYTKAKLLNILFNRYNYFPNQIYCLENHSKRTYCIDQYGRAQSMSES